MEKGRALYLAIFLVAAVLIIAIYPWPRVSPPPQPLAALAQEDAKWLEPDPEVELEETEAPTAPCYVMHLENPYNSTSGCGSRQHRGQFFGLHVCTHDPARDGHMSGPIASGTVPHLESTGYNIAKQHLLAKPEGVVIDAGANIGLFTLLGLLTNHSVVAIEPVPIHTDMLLRTAALNGLQHKLQVYQNALSDQCSTTSMTPVDPSNPGSTSLRASGGNDTEVITIDHILYKLNLAEGIAFLKLDIEGYEAHALYATHLLWRDRPRLIFMEFFAWRLEQVGVNIGDFLRFLLNMGYTLQIFPRLNLHYKHTDLIHDWDTLDIFIKQNLKHNSEMDIMLYRQP